MMNTKQIEQLLNKTIKNVVAEQGIRLSTRKSNKELGLLTKKIARHPFASPQEVITYGEKMGQAIANLSKEKGKDNLDIGVIRQVSFSSPEIIELKKTHPINQPKSSVSAKAEVIVSPKPSDAKEITEVIKDTLKTVEETVSEAVETTEEIAEDVTETVKESVSDAVETAKEETKNTAKMAEKTVSEAVETTEEIAENVAETVKEVVNDTAKTVKQVTEETAEAVEETVNNAVETVQKTIDNDEKKATTLTLKDRIGEDIKTAMKAKDKVRLETVRSIKKAILEKEVELRPSGQESLTSDQELALLSQQAKQRRDSIEQYQKAGREDLVEKESQELAIIETYLPPQLSDEELAEIVTKIIADVGATSPKDMGKVMGVAMKELKGKTDGKKVQAMVKSQLSS